MNLELKQRECDPQTYHNRNLYLFFLKEKRKTTRLEPKFTNWVDLCIF